jgi:hypothetical protein
VNGGIGVNVFKHSQFLVFINDIGWQLMGDNLAEYAGHPFYPLKGILLWISRYLKKDHLTYPVLKINLHLFRSEIYFFPEEAMPC